jgi:hypothetical protein
LRKRIFFAETLIGMLLSLNILFVACDTDKAVSDTKVITSFEIGGVAGMIDEQAIAITVPYGSDITALSPVVLFT